MDISLALGGGGVKGAAHIGVLECLLQAGFRIRAIAGTSAGALVGAFFAAGYQTSEIQAILENVLQPGVYSRRPNDGPSLIGYSGVAEALNNLLGKTEFSDLKIPFACTATDLTTSREIHFHQGLVIDAVKASIAVPGVFPATILDNNELVDGGVMDPVPVSLVRRLAPALPVVAVVLSPAPEEWHQLPPVGVASTGNLPLPTPLVEGISRMRFAQALRIFAQSIDLTSRMITELRLEIDQPEVIIRPDVVRFGMLEMANVREIVETGRRAAENILPQIFKAVSLPNRARRLLLSALHPQKKPDSLPVRILSPESKPKDE